MMLKNLSNYIRYSGVWVGAVINPFHWEFKFEFMHPDELNPAMRGIFVSLGPVWLRGVLDNGSW